MNKIVRRVAKDAAIVIGGILILWIGLQVVFGTTNPFYVVSSESMVPELNVYDILVVQARVPFESIEVGDVIVFNRPVGEDRVIVHRVTMIIDDDPYTLQTKGDANRASIPGTDFPITENDYIGEVHYVVPQAGFITQIFAPPINYILIAIVIGVMVLKALRKGKKDTPPPPAPESLPSDSTYTSGDEIDQQSHDAYTVTDEAQAPQDTSKEDKPQ